MIDQIRREVQRGLAGMRGAMRAVLQGMSIAQRVQRVNAEALAGESLQDVELMQQFGFTSAPPAGAQVIVIPLGGRTSASVIVATEHGSYRLQLNAQGEAAIYNQWGDHVWLKQGGIAEVVASVKVAITSPLVTASGDLQVAGSITSGHRQCGRRRRHQDHAGHAQHLQQPQPRRPAGRLGGWTFCNDVSDSTWTH
jgi:phage baseplate assembly protein V